MLHSLLSSQGSILRLHLLCDAFSSNNNARAMLSNSISPMIDKYLYLGCGCGGDPIIGGLYGGGDPIIGGLYGGGDHIIASGCWYRDCEMIFIFG